MTETIETARLTADVVLLTELDGETHVLLIQRDRDPFKGLWALPGGHVDPGEDVEDTARRELLEETGVTAADLVLIGVYSEPGRDPRGRYVTWAYLAWADGTPTPQAGDDARDAKWIPLDVALAADAGLAFDHHKILVNASAALAQINQNSQKRDSARDDRDALAEETAGAGQ